VFPIWSIPIFPLLKLCFRNSKGAVLAAALSLPSLIFAGYFVLKIDPRLSRPGFERVLQLFSEAPCLAFNAVIGLIYIAQLILVVTRQLEDPPLLSVWTFVNSAVILSLDFAIVAQIFGAINEPRSP
jgi:hypothetical protein